MKRLCVFCGSNPGSQKDYLNNAKALGQALVDNKIDLVYGGARIGLMGAVAEAVLEAGGHVTGVIPESLVEKELVHKGLSELHVVKSMHERKALMAELSDGFIAMPGGMGTLEELCEIVTWSQLGFHQKPIGLLNIQGFYSPFLKMMSHMAKEEFMRSEHINGVVHDDTPKDLIAKMQSYEPVIVKKWLDAAGL